LNLNLNLDVKSTNDGEVCQKSLQDYEKNEQNEKVELNQLVNYKLHSLKRSQQVIEEHKEVLKEHAKLYAEQCQKD